MVLLNDWRGIFEECDGMERNCKIEIFLVISMRYEFKN